MGYQDFAKTALFLSEVTIYCLLHGYIDAYLLTHSFDRGAILLEFELAPSLEEEERL